MVLPTMPLLPATARSTRARNAPGSGSASGLRTHQCVAQLVKRFIPTVFAHENVEARCRRRTGEGCQARLHVLRIAKTDDQNRHAKTVWVGHSGLQFSRHRHPLVVSIERKLSHGSPQLRKGGSAAPPA